jgi:hypothetical protein
MVGTPRRGAVGQALLAKIAVVEGRDKGVRFRAVEKLTDQILLAKIAEEEPNEAVSNGARRRLAELLIFTR